MLSSKKSPIAHTLNAGQKIMSYLQRENNKQIYFESYGESDHAIVLVHGWGMSCRAWDHVLPALVAAGHRIVLLDHRGCGQSDKDFPDMSIGAIADDVVALTDELGLAKIVLSGWSLGGAVVVDAAAKLGDRCSGLVLTGGATPIYTQKSDLLLGGTDEDMAGTLTALSADRVNFLHGLSKVVCKMDVGETIENWFWHIFLQASPLASQTLGELAELDQRETLLGLNLPILTFVGDKDVFVAPEIGRWVAENHPRTTLVELEGVGHAPFIEAPQMYLEKLLGFLANEL